MIGSDDPMWELSPKEAVECQRELAARVILRPLSLDFEILGAADLTYISIGAEKLHIAVLAAYSWPELELLETVHVEGLARFPYVPGLLSFREIPPLLEAFSLLKHRPQVILCDGQGMAHPRGIGLASHLGLCLEIPTVGCAKKRLCGEHEEPPPERGGQVPLWIKGVRTGAVLRSRDRVKPLFVSPGHLSDVDTSVELVMRCLGRYRIPDPLRWAHNRASQIRKERLG